MNEVYFGKDGLSSTSANYVANKSKEIIEGILAETRGITFINKRYTVVGCEPVTADAGKNMDWLKKAIEGINRVGDLAALNAWLREAIKEKDKETSRLRGMLIKEWAEANGKTLPKPPEAPENPDLSSLLSVEESAILNDLDAHERQKYLRLEAKAAALGKFVHKGEPFEEARKALHKLAGHTDVQGVGSELTITTFTPSIDIGELDKVYMEVQEAYRSVQAELNGLKHKIKLEQTRRESENIKKANELNEAFKIKQDEYRRLYSEYITALQAMNLEFEQWRKSEVQRVAELKIVIPEALQEIYTSVKNS